MNRLTDSPNLFPPAPPDVDPVELALRFLEADPIYDGADALKHRLALSLRSARLTPDQRNRAAALLLRALRHGSDALFRAYATLAPAVTTPLFEAAVTCYAASCEYPVADRARRMLDALRGEQGHPQRPICAG